MLKHSNVSYKSVNASEEESVIEAFSDLDENSVDFVLNTVGISAKDTPFDNFNNYSNVIDVNIFGNIIPIKELVNRNVIAKGARVVVIGSTSGHFAPKTMAPYAVSKWILVNICSSLQHELHHLDISLKVVNPRSIQNERSEIFGSTKGIDVNKVVTKIMTDGYQCFCPWYYGAFHFIERTNSWIFDKAFGLPLHITRKKNYTSDLKSVLITGASSGLGKELAYRFAGTCEKLYLAARNQEALIEIQKSLSDYQCEIVPLYLDLSDLNSVRDLAQRLRQKPIDLIINNAGQHVTGSILNTDITLYRKSIRINCLSHILLTAELIEISQPKCIVNLLSTTAISGRTNLGMYSSPKAGLWAWTKVLRRNYGKSINVIEVIPATFKSELHNKGVSSATYYVNQGKSIISSRKMGLTSKDVSEIVFNGIINHRDKIFIPSLMVKLFVALESLFPSIFRKLFS